VRFIQANAIALTVVAIQGAWLADSASARISTSTRRPGSLAAGAAAGSPASSVAGVQERGRILGRPSAPVTLVVFSDLQCPACLPFFLKALPALLPRWVTTGFVRLEYRSFETATRGPLEFIEEVSAADAAGAQNLEWAYVESFFEAQRPEDSEYVNAAFLEEIAARTPKLDRVAWQAHHADPRYQPQIVEDQRLAERHRIIGDPSFLIGRTRRTLRLFEPVAYSAATFARAFRSILRGRR
jgi:protein-disulfide isomerase